MQPAEYHLMDGAEAHLWWYRALHTRLMEAMDGHTASGAAGSGAAGVRAQAADRRSVDEARAATPGSGTNMTSEVRPAGTLMAGRVLDAGCGTGGFLAALGSHRPDLERVGVEWDPAAASRAWVKSGAGVLRGTVNALPFADGSFDAAVCADVLCHAAVDPAIALRELQRVLRPGGRLVVNMPAYQWLLSAHDRRVHNVRRLTASGTAVLLRRAGFNPVRTRYWNGILLPLMILRRKILTRSYHVSDVAVFPPWLNAMLLGVTELERRLPFALPIGGSVLAIAEKP